MIPDLDNSSIETAMDYIHCKKKDSDTALEAKMKLIWGLVNRLSNIKNANISKINKQCLLVF